MRAGEEVATNASRGGSCFFGLAFAAFILYGSLIPFSLQWRSLDEAWRVYLGLGGDSEVRLSLTDFATNLFLFAPLAFLWTGCLQVRGVKRGAAVSIVIACGGFSAILEFVQVFFPPRTSSIYDLAANITGAIAGTIAWEWLGVFALTAAAAAARGYFLPDEVHRRLRSIAIAAAAPYALALTAANGWFAGPWVSLGDAMTRLRGSSFIPFYLHQSASIGLAMASSLWHCALYIPLGCGLRLFTREPLSTGRTLLTAGAYGAAVATLMEGAKLFVPSKHPDTGDILLGAVAAIFGFVVWPSVLCLVRGGSSASSAPTSPRPTVISRAPLLPRAVSLVFAAGVTLALARFPVMSGLLAVGLATYAMALTRWPWIWLWVVPATLPVLDLAPLSGWFFLDEFDLVVLTTLGVSLWTGRYRLGSELHTDAGFWLTLLFAASVLISTCFGLWPLQPVDPNAFSSYYSHYNALRVGKGFVWALALTPLLLSNVRDRVSVSRYFTLGVVSGLAGATMLALWERYAYPGLFDFSREFRVGAFFSSMHNGGSYIEAYIVAAMPFLVVEAYFTRSWLVRIAMGFLFIAATYVLMVTFSRGGYLALALALAVLAAASIRIAILRASWRLLATLCGMTAFSLLVALPIGLGTFAQQRIGASLHDLGVRVLHWEDTWEIMDPGLTSRSFGMGLGRYPETYFYRNREGKLPATFRYGSESGNTYLKLGSGDRLYVEQIVSVAPAHDYRLSLDVRSSGGPAAVNLLLCERTYFYTYGCETATIDDISTGGQWVHHEATLSSGKLGGGAWFARRPVKLSLEDPNSGTSVDVDNVALFDESGTNLVANGDFSHGHAYWFFSSREHLPWHTKNLGMELLFEQGWFGVLAFAAVILLALFRLARTAWDGDPLGGAALASMLGFLSVGLFDSLFDAPRLTTLFFMTLVASGALLKFVRQTETQPTTQTAQSRHRVDTREPKAAPRPPGTRSIGRDNKFGRRLAPTWPGLFPSKSAIYSSLIGILIGGLAIGLITRSPLVPYNLRNLPNPAHEYAAPVVLAIFFYWVFAVPVWMTRWFAQARAAALIFPLAVVLHGAAAWAIVRYAVYPIMINKVTGSPVLGWPGDWETLARFTVLEGTVFMLLTGACTIVSIGTGRTSINRLLIWLGWAVLLLPIAHYVIVVYAATDNLAELMADGGSASASLILAAWVMVFGAGASMLAECIATRRRWAAVKLTLIVLSIPMGFGLLTLGTEAVLVKYDAVFSGLQFLLSSDRAHYATGWELGLRYLIFHAGLLCAVALAQYPLWAISSKERMAAR